MIKELTKKILSNKNSNLNQSEIKEVFDEIYQGLSNEIASTALITALENINKSEEIFKAIIDSSTDAIIHPSHSLINTFQSVNLNHDEKIFDIFFASDVINSANNLKTIKFANNYSNNNYLFNKYSINFNNYSQEFIDFIEEISFCYYYLDDEEKYSKYTNLIRKNTDFSNIFDFVDYFLNPFNIKNQIIGLSDYNKIDFISKLMLMLNYENTVVVSSESNLPFATLNGKNYVAECWKNKVFTYTLDAELVDLPKYDLDKIKVESAQESEEIIKNVFNNKIKDVYYYTIVLNAGLSLYISKKSPSLIDGIKLAQITIDSNLANEKLSQIEKQIQKFNLQN